MLLYIIRHGDPIYNPDSLTPYGTEQAEKLGRRFVKVPFDRVFASTNKRAQLTAAPTCRIQGITPEICAWMSEDIAWKELTVVEPDGHRHWGFQSPITDIKNDDTIDRRVSLDTIPAFIGKTEGRSLDAGYARIMNESDAFIAALGYAREGAVYRILQPSDQRIAVFCHQGFGLTWLSHLLQIPPHIFWGSFDISTSGVTILEFQNYDSGVTSPRCLCLSDLSHLYTDGEPQTYNKSRKL